MILMDEKESFWVDFQPRCILLIIVKWQADWVNDVNLILQKLKNNDAA